MRIRNDMISNIPGYDLDSDGDNSPWMWYGSAAVSATMPPWSDAPLGSLYIYNPSPSSSTFMQKVANNKNSNDWKDITISSASELAARVIVVHSGGQYSSLSAALSAITDAADNNEYLIIVDDEITETSAVIGKSHVHVFFMPGALVTIATDSVVNGVNLQSITNSTWAAAENTRPHIIRTGTVTNTVYGLSVQGATVNLSNLNIENRVTGTSSNNHGMVFNASVGNIVGVTAKGGSGTGGGNGGMYIDAYSLLMHDCYGIGGNVGDGSRGIIINGSPTMTNCTGTGGDGGTNCDGIYINGSPTMANCTGTGGDGGTSCDGIYINGSPTMTNCTGTGGDGGTSCNGIYVNGSPTMTNCIGTGGDGGTNCDGIYIIGSPTMTNCTGTGGDGGTNCDGIYITGSLSQAITDCVGIGGNGGDSCYGIATSTNVLSAFNNCVGIGGGLQLTTTSASFPASSRQEDSFQPGSTFPYKLVGASINVTAAASPGVTLTLRDAAGGLGNAITGPVAVDSTGVKYFPITGQYVIGAGGYVYARLSAVDSTLAYTITYVYEKDFNSCYGLYHNSDGACRFNNCTFLSNASSDAVYVTSKGDDRSVFLGGVASSGLNSATRPKAFACQSAWNPGNVYNMVLDGGSTNLTAATGTANGTNVEV